MPKSIDNDVACTDMSIGFDTALGIATEAVDRLHSTAHSHHRIIVVELMGHNTGWLALGAGIAGGADVILIPEIPYNTDVVAEAILERSRGGKRFSIVAVSEGAMSPGRCGNIRASCNMIKKRLPIKRKRTKPRRAWRSFRPTIPATRCAWRSSWNKLHRAGIPGDHPRVCAARRNPLCDGPADRHRAGRFDR